MYRSIVGYATCPATRFCQFSSLYLCSFPFEMEKQLTSPKWLPSMPSYLPEKATVVKFLLINLGLANDSSESTYPIVVWWGHWRVSRRSVSASLYVFQRTQSLARFHQQVTIPERLLSCQADSWRTKRLIWKQLKSRMIPRRNSRKVVQQFQCLHHLSGPKPSGCNLFHSIFLPYFLSAI